MTNKQPFTPIFFGDFLASTAEWEGEERALYLLLLCYQWTLGSLPNGSAKLSKLIGYDRQYFEKYWVTISDKFDLVDDRLINQRLEVHRAKAAEISSKRAAAGANGGKVAQAKFKQMLDKSEANAPNLLLHPNQSKPIQPKLNNREEKIHAPEGVSVEVWDSFVQQRKKARAVITPTVVDTIAKEAAKANWTLEEALAECAARGWRGFKAEWVKAKHDPSLDTYFDN